MKGTKYGTVSDISVEVELVKCCLEV